MAVTPLPALTRNYWSRNNVPYADNSTVAILGSFPMWALAHLLLDLLVTGTASAARPTAGKWICRGSSDGVGGGAAVSSPGAIGTNLWWNAGVFPAAGLVGAANGTDHHWMLLEHTTLGYELLLNMGSAGNTNVTINIGKVGTFSGGGAADFPLAATAPQSVQAQGASYNTSTGGQSALFGDLLTGNTNYCHITVADTGEFIFTTSRAGFGTFTGAVAVWRSVGQQAGDTDNTFLIAGSSEVSAPRGCMKAGQVTVYWFASSRQPGGATKTAGGVLTSMAGGVDAVMGRAADAISGSFDAEPMFIRELTPQLIRRGSLPDIYTCGTEAVGAPIPAAGATQIRVVIGDTIWPCIIVQPTV